CRAPRSQSAQVPYSRDSSTRHSPTSKTTALITRHHYQQPRPVRSWGRECCGDGRWLGRRAGRGGQGWSGRPAGADGALMLPAIRGSAAASAVPAGGAVVHALAAAAGAAATAVLPAAGEPVVAGGQRAHPAGRL